MASIEKMLQCPPGQWTLPKLNASQPIFVWIQLGEKKRLAIFDARSPQDEFYTRFYFDNNGNGDLTDEKPIENDYNHSSEFYYRSQFPAIDTFIELGGSSLPYRFHPDVYFFGFDPNDKRGPLVQKVSERMFQQQCNASIHAECSYYGEFTLGGRVYQVRLGDKNANGRFNDVPAVPEKIKDREGLQPFYPDSDTFYLAEKGKPVSYYDGLACGDRMLLGGQWFEVSIRTPEARILLTPMNGPFVPLTLGAETDRISLASVSTTHCLMMYQPGREIRVPPDRYRLLEYVILRKEESGALWRLAASASCESPVVAADGKSPSPASLPMGEPYGARIELPEWMRQQAANGAAVPEIRIEFTAYGAGREIVTDLRCMGGADKSRIPLSAKEGNGDRPKEPQYKIVKMDGEVAASGSFEYG